jgi:hypothetical protein
MTDTQHDGDAILHQDAVEQVIDDKLVDASDEAAIADLPAASSSYVQAEATDTRTTLNKVLGVLRDAGLIPSE